MAKTEVNGADPVWNYCKMAFPGQVQWNFAAECREQPCSEHELQNMHAG